MPSLWPWLLTVAVSAASGAGLAWKAAADRGEARRIECERARERDARAAAEKTAALLARAQDAEADAARRLAAAEAASRKKIEETRREIYRLASGRECLSGALRLRLNAAIAADDLPQAAGGAAGAPAAAADDTAVALWIADAARAFDACRARIDALRHWDEVTHGR